MAARLEIAQIVLAITVHAITVTVKLYLNTLMTTLILVTLN